MREDSEHYRLGLEHGKLDAEAASACPPRPEIGPAPPNPARSYLYHDGYRDGYGDPARCQCAGH